MLRGSWLSSEALERLQLRRLQLLLQHAATRSPLWRERFAALGATPADVQSVADLTLLPVTTREDLRAPERLLAEGFVRKGLKVATTSGSTGRRTTSYFDRDAWYIGKHLLKLRARIRLWHAPERSGRPVPGSRPRAAPVPLRWAGADLLDHVPPEEIIDDVAEFAPEVLYGFPGHLLLLGLAAGGRVRPRLVFTSGELLAEATRRQLEALLGARVYDVYGSTEAKEIAWECPERVGYHVNADWVIVETVPATDELGRTTDRILVTSLANHAMPLIRYAIGGTASSSPGAALADVACP